VIRIAWLIFGSISLILGAIGAFVPLLPTVPLVVLAAFCFARSNPLLERRLVEHPRFRRHILAWRQSGAISRDGKRAAAIAFALSAAIGLAALPLPWALAPLMAAVIGGSWIMTRPTA
jgi:uncharacterized membrane protein YbaN (DUF454 family)